MVILWFGTVNPQTFYFLISALLKTIYSLTCGLTDLTKSFSKENMRGKRRKENKKKSPVLL